MNKIFSGISHTVYQQAYLQSKTRNVLNTKHIQNKCHRNMLILAAPGLEKSPGGQPYGALCQARRCWASRRRCRPRLLSWLTSTDSGRQTHTAYYNIDLCDNSRYSSKVKRRKQDRSIRTAELVVHVM